MIINFLPQIEAGSEIKGQAPLAIGADESASFVDALFSALSPRVLAEDAGAADVAAANTAAVDEDASKGAEVHSGQMAQVDEDTVLAEAVIKEGEAVDAASTVPIEAGFIEQGRVIAAIQLSGLKPETKTANSQERTFIDIPARGLAMGHAVAIEAGVGLKTGLLAHTDISNEAPATVAAWADVDMSEIEAPVEGRASGEYAAAETEAVEVPEMMPAEEPAVREAQPEAAEMEAPLEKMTVKAPVNSGVVEIKADTGVKPAKAEKAGTSAPVLPGAERLEATETRPEVAETNAVEADAIEEFSPGAERESGFEGDSGASDNNGSHQYRPVAVAAGVKFNEVMDSPSATRPVQPEETLAELQERLNAGIKISVQKNGGEVRMKLNPEHLGEIVIRLTIENGTVKADIRAESVEIKQLLETDSSMLKEALGSHGLHLKECTIGVSRAEQNLSGGDGKWTRENPDHAGRRDDGRRNEWHGHKEGREHYGRPGKSGNIDIFA